MADNNSYKQTPRRRGPGGGMAPAEKAKNFKGTLKKLCSKISNTETTTTLAYKHLYKLGFKFPLPLEYQVKSPEENNQRL